MGPFGLGFPSEVSNNGWRLYILSLVMVIAAGLFVSIRLTTRVIKSQTGWDDATIVSSLLVSILVSVFMQLAIENGYGMHKTDLTEIQLHRALKFFFLAQTPYKICVCLNKVSTILFCLRIFVSRRFRITAFTVMGVVIAWSVGGVGATIWQCVPIRGAWNQSVDSKCIDSGKFWIAYAVMNILTDVMVLALPIPSILRLQLHGPDKILLCGIFAMGILVTITSVLRTTSVQNSIENKHDITFNFIQRGMWTLLEINLGIISACLPALHKPTARLIMRALGQKSETARSHVRIRDPTGASNTLNSAHLSSVKAQTIVTSIGRLGKVRRSDELEIMASTSKSCGSGMDLQLREMPSGDTASGKD